MGTSGWTYPHWRGIFYPESLQSAEYLLFYSRHFRTTEVNYSFYHVPRPETYRKWASGTPDEFVFAVKVSRTITHLRKLADAENLWDQFLENAKALGPKLGPLLVQLPPSLRCDPELLGSFLSMVSPAKNGLRLAIEFRHASWFTSGIEGLLERYGVALVVAHSSRYPLAPLRLTTNFAYFRFHGPARIFASSYSDEELSHWANLMSKWLKEGHDVYAYFNNDANGCAVANARTLIRLLEDT